PVVLRPTRRRGSPAPDRPGPARRLAAGPGAPAARPGPPALLARRAGAVVVSLGRPRPGPDRLVRPPGRGAAPARVPARGGAGRPVAGAAAGRRVARAAGAGRLRGRVPGGDAGRGVGLLPAGPPAPRPAP